MFMQTLEPLGATDTAFDAAWDYTCNCWRKDLVSAARSLAPSMVRWGGNFTHYYRWKEAVGPREKRKPVYNLSWGGMETNQVGTAELINFCRQIKANPFITVSLAGGGRKKWQADPKGESRITSAREAADWVDYCNNPDNALRISHGFPEPLTVKFWQLGNETSYGVEGVSCYDFDTTAKHTIAFAKAMRKRDPSIKLIGWGDSGWASPMIDAAGEHLDYIAFHHHFNSGLKNSPLNTSEYRKDPERTWQHLMNAYKSTELRLRRIKEEIAGSGIHLALTEGHFSLEGRNRCEVLTSWAAGVANARILNVHERYGDVLKIATLADFFGNRWNVNALMIPTPAARGNTYMLPVARVMALYRHHRGNKALTVLNSPDGLDITASRTGNRIFLHVVNIQRTKFVRAKLQIPGMSCKKARAFEICDDPDREIGETRPELFSPVERSIPLSLQWSFPAASVTAIELTVKKNES